MSWDTCIQLGIPNLHRAHCLKHAKAIAMKQLSDLRGAQSSLRLSLNIHMYGEYEWTSQATGST